MLLLVEGSLSSLDIPENGELLSMSEPTDTGYVVTIYTTDKHKHGCRDKIEYEMRTYEVDTEGSASQISREVIHTEDTAYVCRD